MQQDKSYDHIKVSMVDDYDPYHYEYPKCYISHNNDRWKEINRCTERKPS